METVGGRGKTTDGKRGAVSSYNPVSLFAQQTTQTRNAREESVLGMPQPPTIGACVKHAKNFAKCMRIGPGIKHHKIWRSSIVYYNSVPFTV